jgi:outer membrane protein OmpA-like peptidoglycan-associated protein
VRVIGHTDSSGPEWVNDSLSTQRAASVARFLALRGIPSERLSSEGRGMRELKIDVEQEQRLGPGINRRIEIEVRTSEANPE